MGVSKPLHVAMLVFLVLLGAQVVDGYFLASARGESSQPVLEVASKKPEDSKPGDKSDNSGSTDEKMQEEVDKSGKNSVNTNEEKTATEAPEFEKYKPLFEHARKSTEEQSHHKYPIIQACHMALSKVFAKYSEHWWMDWKLYTGLMFWCAVWSKWLMYGYVEVYYERAIHSFGVNILILHILQYASTILYGMLGVCALLTAQTLFGCYWWYETDAADKELDDFDCDTLYLDIALPVEQILILFIAQFGVWWFYMTSILGNFNFANVNYLYWFWAYLVMQMTMIFNRGEDSVLGNAFPVNEVQRMVQVANKVQFAIKDEPEGGMGKFQLSKANIIMRGVLGFLCNSILRDIMAYTIPLMLMGFSEPMDFVVYCVGVNFICTLDDMSDRKYEMTEIKEEPNAMADIKEELS